MDKLRTVGICASFTIDNFLPYLRYWQTELELQVKYTFSAYNQVLQELFSETGLLAKSTCCNILFLRVDDWIRDRATRPGEDNFIFIREVFAEFVRGVEVLKSRNSIPLIIISVSSDFQGAGGHRVSIIDEMLLFMQAKFKNRSVFFFDAAEIARLYDVSTIYDPISDRIAHLPFTEEFAASLCTFITRQISTMLTPPRKVILLDCDNTLWSGICGECSTTDLIVDEKCQFVQKFCLKKRSEGFLLCLLSKNNENDVLHVFDTHPGMILTRDHLTAWCVNWNPKYENINILLKALNLRADAAIFIDDSAFEIESMTTHCPDVLSLILPEHYEDCRQVLEHVWSFDRLVLTEEDINRPIYYSIEAERVNNRLTFVSAEDFINSLNVSIECEHLTDLNVERATQLSLRTNQFNLNGVVFSEPRLRELCIQSYALCWLIRVTDRFGDYGTVGFVLGIIDSESLILNSFLLSCRVLGRRVEDMILGRLKACAPEARYKRIIAPFVDTGRNQPFLEFLVRTHWLTSTGENKYTLEI